MGALWAFFVKGIPSKDECIPDHVWNFPALWMPRARYVGEFREMPVMQGREMVELGNAFEGSKDVREVY